MKKTIAFVITFAMLLTTAACANNDTEDQYINIEPRLSQMRSICELAVMECYYHNVAKYKQENAEGFWFWTKDKHFWIQYDGIVKLGINVSLVKIEINDLQVSITIPPAEVQSYKVDANSLTDESFIVDKNSAQINADDETFAFQEAERQLMDTVSNDNVLLAEAQQRAMSLLEDYITNISNVTGKKYIIKWIYIDLDGNIINKDDTIQTTINEETPASTDTE